MAADGAKRKPRLQVSVEPEIHQAIYECAEVFGISVSSLIAQMVVESVPTIQKMAKAFKAAKDKQGDAFAIYSAAVQDVVSKATQASFELGQMTATPRRAKGAKKKG